MTWPDWPSSPHILRQIYATGKVCLHFCWFSLGVAVIPTACSCLTNSSHCIISRVVADNDSEHTRLYAIRRSRVASSARLRVGDWPQISGTKNTQQLTTERIQTALAQFPKCIQLDRHAVLCALHDWLMSGRPPAKRSSAVSLISGM